MSFDSETNCDAVTLDSILDWLEVIVISVFAVVLLFSFVIRLFSVKGPSMNSTLYDSDKLLVTNVMYTPKQGDVVVLYSDVLEEMIVKRVIATEGQTVTIDYENNQVSVDGTDLNEDYTYDFMTDTGLFDMNYYDESSGKYVYNVPEDCVFVMGDNRNRSTDSRSIGFISNDDIVGKVFLRFSTVENKFEVMTGELMN